MIRGIFAFILMWAAIIGCIEIWRTFTKQEKWNFIKTAGYATITALITLIIVTIIVILF